MSSNKNNYILATGLSVIKNDHPQGEGIVIEIRHESHMPMRRYLKLPDTVRLRDLLSQIIKEHKT